ncbi:hypothetical protein N8135_03470 [Oceanospirillaceae bacterium]|nr:hypothetical protein [Oceanospirillaceae bacterium]
MNIKVMYFSYQPYFIDLAKEMEKDGWEPIYWSVVPSTEKKVKSLYPNSICHNHYDAMKGIPPIEYRDRSLNPLCPSVLSQLANNERIALRMLERNDSHANNFSHKERVELYKYLVQYWSTVLADLSPNYVVFEEEPHQISGYVLYAVCQILEVDTIMFIRTKFPKRMYPVYKFEEGSEKILLAYRDQLAKGLEEPPKLTDSMTEYFSNLQGSYDKAVSVHLYNQIDEVQDIRANKSKSLLAIIKSVVSKFNRTDMATRWQLIISKPGTQFVSDQKQKNKTFRDSNLTYLQYLYYISKAIRKKKKLKSYYQSIANKDYDFKKPYVFCALHYQPEKTTCPLGGDFEDQVYMISLLSEALPEGWLLYVKDHLSQFVSSKTRYGENFRSIAFYESIEKFSNVRLLPLETNTFDLIDNSKAVATVTGTSAWEAVVRGVPALVFGYCWFKHCNGVFYVYSYNSVENAFQNILNGYKVKKYETQLFAKVVEENSFKGVVGGPGIRKYFNISDRENGIAHSKAIKKLL